MCWSITKWLTVASSTAWSKMTGQMDFVIRYNSTYITVQHTMVATAMSANAIRSTGNTCVRADSGKK